MKHSLLLPDRFLIALFSAAACAQDNEFSAGGLAGQAEGLLI
jgi:hypothetical protein